MDVDKEKQARAMAKVSTHEGIVTIHDVTERDGGLCLVTTHLAGGSLRDRLDAAGLGSLVALFERAVAQGAELVVSLDDLHWADPSSLAFLEHLTREIRRARILVVCTYRDVEVGRHGLLISHKGRRGVLLPQVPVEHAWDRETFLDHTCLKAGLLPGAWQEDGVELLGFTAEVFGEGSEPQV